MLQMFKGIAFHQMFIPVDHDWELVYSREESCRKKLISGTFMVCFILYTVVQTGWWLCGVGGWSRGKGEGGEEGMVVEGVMEVIE